MSETSKTSPMTSLELHLLAALQSIDTIAAQNEGYHTGFTHIRQIAKAWLSGREASNQDSESA